MIALLYGAALAMAGTPQSATEQCRAAVAAKTGSSPTVSVARSTQSGAWTIVDGRVTSLLGSPQGGPGTYSPHHLIRQDRQFTCWVRGGRVRKIAITD